MASSAQFKVAVLGAGGGIGQPLSLLLKQSPLISVLSLYDVANTAGVACDISHISTAARVQGFTGAAQLGEALAGCQLVVIPAGVWGPGQGVGYMDGCFGQRGGGVSARVGTAAARAPLAMSSALHGRRSRCHISALWHTRTCARAPHCTLQPRLQACPASRA